MLKVAILGCPNVGKSTLFNKMVRKKQALIEDMPGVTRDYNEGICSLMAGTFIVIDSPGWSKDDIFSESMQDKIQQVLKISDVILFMIEQELTLADKEFSLWLHKNTNLPVILVINKCDRQENSHEYELGWHKIIHIAAQHNIGLNNLYDAITKYITNDEKVIVNDLTLSIVGRPNVGKSTFINQLIKENRVITSPISGTTRDAIAIQWNYKGKNITLTDTAGMRKKAKIQENIETSSVSSSIHAIRKSDIVVLMIDAERGLEHQDITIADLAIKNGRSLLLAVNKADLATTDGLEYIKNYCLRKLPYSIPIISISAMKNKSCNKVINECIKLYSTSQKTITTNQLNKWLSQAVAQHPLPLSSRKTELRLKFINQVGNFPLTFKIIANRPEDVNSSYIKYLTHNLRNFFGLSGVPIKILLEKNHNPYIS